MSHFGITATSTRPLGGGNVLNHAAMNAAAFAEAMYDIPPVNEIAEFEIAVNTKHRFVRWLFWVLVVAKCFRGAMRVAERARVEVLVNGKIARRSA